VRFGFGPDRERLRLADRRRLGVLELARQLPGSAVLAVVTGSSRLGLYYYGLRRTPAPALGDRRARLPR
jgi:hypothetical protein